MNEKLVREVGDLKVKQVKYIVIWVTYRLCLNIIVRYLSMKKCRKHKYVYI